MADGERSVMYERGAATMQAIGNPAPGRAATASRGYPRSRPTTSSGSWSSSASVIPGAAKARTSI